MGICYLCVLPSEMLSLYLGYIYFTWEIQEILLTFIYPQLTIRLYWWSCFTSLNHASLPPSFHFFSNILIISWLNTLWITTAVLKAYAMTSFMITPKLKFTLYPYYFRNISQWRFTDFAKSGPCRFLLRIGSIFWKICVLNCSIVFIDRFYLILYIFWWRHY